MKLANKIAVVTGAGSGIGRATAKILASEGATVVVVDIDAKGGSETAKTINESGGSAIFQRCDVTNEKDIESLADMLRSRFGKVDVLFNNAGVELIRSLTATSEKEWDKIMDVNAKGVFLCSKHIVPLMKTNGGSIINAGSVAGLVGTQLNVAYCASKGAVVLMTKAMAIELAEFKIRVNATCPAAVATPLMEREIVSFDVPADQVRRQTIEAHPLKRMASPEEIAKAVLYLASDDSSFVTGSNLVVDGGYTAQ